MDSYGSRVNGGRERETAFAFRPGAPPEAIYRTLRDVDRIAGYRRDGQVWAPAQLSGVGEIYRTVTLALREFVAGPRADEVRAVPLAVVVHIAEHVLVAGIGLEIVDVGDCLRRPCECRVGGDVFDEPLAHIHATTVAKAL